MYTLVAYYSYTGRSRYEAMRIAKELDAEIYEVRELHYRRPINAYLFGAWQAKHRKTMLVEPFAVDMNEYDRIIIVCPIWGGYPAPVFNNIVKELPCGKEVELIFTSDSGRAKARAITIMYVEGQGVSVVQYKVIKNKKLHKR